MTRIFILVISFLAVVLVLGMLAALYESTFLIMATIGVAIFIVAFLNSEAALYILIFSMLLSPEIIVSETASQTLGRGGTLRLDDFFLLVIGTSWFAKASIHKDLGLFLRTPLNKPIFYYLVACIVSTGFGIMAGRVGAKSGFFFVLKYFEYFLVYFMVANHLENQAQVNRLVFCLLATCFIVSIYGILHIPGGGRVSAPFEGEVGEPNTFGGYLVFLGAVAAGIYFKVRDKITQRLLILLIAVIIPPFLYTESRASYLAFIPVAFVLVLLTERRLLLVLILLTGLAFAPLLLPSPVKQRILFTFQQPVEQGQIEIGDVRLDTSTSARLKSWKGALTDWLAHPLLGYGVTGYKFIDAQFPRVLVETGIIGFSAFIYLLYSIFRLARKNLYLLKRPYHQGLSVGFMAGFVGLLFHAIGANTFIIVRIMEPFWLVAGIVAVLGNLENAQIVKAAEITR